MATPTLMRAGTRRRGIAGILLLVCVLGKPLAAFDFQEGAEITLEDFKTQGQDDDGAEWRLSGGRAVIRGGVYHLENVRVVMYTSEGKQFVIESPSCIYRQERGVIESDDRVHVTGDGLVLDGIGYDILINEKQLRIREAVRMVVDRMRQVYPDVDAGRETDKDNRSPTKEGRAP